MTQAFSTCTRRACMRSWKWLSEEMSEREAMDVLGATVAGVAAAASLVNGDGGLEGQDE